VAAVELREALVTLASFVTYLWHYFLARSLWEALSGRHPTMTILLVGLVVAVVAIVVTRRSRRRWR
jgi:peptidoglycan/LPS O-acetylase OafA/YrhL